MPIVLPCRPCHSAVEIPASTSCLAASSARACVGTRTRTRWGKPRCLASGMKRAIISREYRDLPVPVVIFTPACNGSERPSGAISCQERVSRLISSKTASSAALAVSTGNLAGVSACTALSRAAVSSMTSISGIIVRSPVPVMRR